VCPTHVLWRYDRELCDEKHCLACVLAYRRPPQAWRYSGMLEREMATSMRYREECLQPRHAPEVRLFAADGSGSVLSADAMHLRDAAARPHEKAYFLFVGRLEKIKGVQDILPAVRRRARSGSSRHRFRRLRSRASVARRRQTACAFSRKAARGVDLALL
jgi:glycosyltransferase involved in cell wall biosynthesis